MTEEIKRNWWRSNQIIVINLRMDDKSKCGVRGCNKHDKYGVCMGGTQMSNLLYICCGKHLDNRVTKALNHRYEFIKKKIEEGEARELKDAQELIKEKLSMN